VLVKGGCCLASFPSRNTYSSFQYSTKGECIAGLDFACWDSPWTTKASSDTLGLEILVGETSKTPSSGLLVFACFGEFDVVLPSLKLCNSDLQRKCEVNKVSESPPIWTEANIESDSIFGKISARFFQIKESNTMVVFKDVMTANLQAQKKRMAST
jgi:hypothetical protein